MKLNEIVKRLAVVPALMLALAAPAQMPAPEGDQVDQLAEVLGLSEEQQSEIRALIEDIGPRIEALQAQSQAMQMELRTHVGHDYDEAAIREGAQRLGEITGEVTALSLLLQSKVQAVFTPEQREELEEQARRQQELEQQMMEQQFQQQQQQQQEPQPEW